MAKRNIKRDRKGGYTVHLPPEERELLRSLPAQFREVLVLRELEDLSYRDIARIAGAPIGTVMSRLSRARRLLAESLRVIVTASEPGVSR